MSLKLNVEELGVETRASYFVFTLIRHRPRFELHRGSDSNGCFRRFETRWAFRLGIIPLARQQGACATVPAIC